MKHLDPRDLECAFVPADTPRLSELAPLIEANPDLSTTRRRDLLSALSVTARIIGWPAEEIPADAAWLRRKLDAMTPAAHKMTPKRWGKVLSDLKAAFRAGGIKDHVQGGRGRLAPDWAHLRDTLRSKDGERHWRGLSRFARFCTNLDIPPETVHADTLDAFAEALRQSEVRKNPDHTVYCAATSWNAARKLVPNWPGDTLPVPKRHGFYSLPPEQFTDSFNADLDRYAAQLRGEDILGEGPDRPLAPQTVDSNVRALRRFASAAVLGGIDIYEIDGLAGLVRLDVVKAGLTYMATRAEAKKSAGLGNMAKLLVKVARHYVHLPGPELEELKSIPKRVTPPRQKGMTVKNRDRLRQVFSDDNLDRLLALPTTLETRAGGLDLPRKAALLLEIALAIDLLTVTALRIKNLAALHLERNIVRSRDGAVWLVFSEAEVKNGLAIDKPLPVRTVTLLDRFLAGPRDLLLDRPSPWLFSARRRPESICPRNFGKRIAKTIRDETGLAMNPHLFRHTTAKLILDANPGAYGAARLVLGHAKESSTIDAYAGLEGEAAARAYDRLLSERRNRHDD